MNRWSAFLLLAVAGGVLALPAVARRDGAASGGANPRASEAVSPAAVAREGLRVREPITLDEIQTGAPTAKAVTDTVTLMGPGGLYPFRGDFETTPAMPDSGGALTAGWTSVDETAPENHWHVATYNNPGSGNGAWCGDTFPSCEAGDPVGGYGNDWYDVLEFRKAVADPGLATAVRVRAALRHDSEASYDWVYLARRTAAAPDFEATVPWGLGQGLSWTDYGTEIVDYTFHFEPGEYLDGEVRLAFVFDSDGGWSDSDCRYQSAGGAIVDNLVVTCTGGLVATYTEDFEDGVIGPDWGLTSPRGAGDFALVWQGLCVDDVCDGNNSKQVAFIDTYPELDPAPWPPAGCGAVNTRGGFREDWATLDNAVVSPVMPLPGGADGLTLAFDVYQDEPLIAGESACLFWAWGVRSAVAPADLRLAPWRDRSRIYYGGPDYKRVVQNVGDLLTPGATVVQVQLELVQNTQWIDPPGHRRTPAPYFDNVRVSAYHDVSGGPAISASEGFLANDAFPASGTLNLSNLGANSVRFDMARNIAARTHLRNDPGDSIWVDVTTRSGATLSAPPVMYWTLARRNALFDPYRTLPANPVTGVPARLIGFAAVANRWRFDLPDTGMLFPGDVLHYYFSATDNRAGNVGTTTLPAELAGFGSPDPLLWPSLYTVRCLPTVFTATGTQFPLLVWNDQGCGTGEDEWYNAMRHVFLSAGIDCDVYTTHAAVSGLGNGLGGRATAAQLAGYTDILYTCGDLDRYTLANGDYAGDPGNDLAVLNGWLAAGGRDLLLAGNHLTEDLNRSGAAAASFLATAMGVQFVDDDVSDNLDGQRSPGVVSGPSNPVLPANLSWLAFGGCPGRTSFDRVQRLATTVPLARYVAPDGVSTPYAAVPACLNFPGGNRVVTLTNDPASMREPAKSSAPRAARTKLLANILSYFEVATDPGEPMAPVPAATAALTVAAQPNPFNPAVTLRYALPAPGHVTMKVFDARGRLVRTLLNQDAKVTAGAVTWRGDDDRGARAASGTYFVETRAGGQVDVRKVTMVK